MNRDKTLAIIIKLKDEASKQAKSIGDAFRGLMSAIKSAAKIAAVIAGIGIAIAAMAAKGEDLRTMEQGFASLAANIGESAQEMLGSMKEASFGLISDFNLIKSANKALILGLPAGAEAMGELAQAAVRLGLATGTDAAQALDQLTSGIATQRKMTLQQLGITIDATVANEKFAKANDLVSKSLTEEQKKTAFFNETLEQARMRIEELGDFSVGFGGQIDQVKISIANFSRDAAKFVSTFGDAFLKAFTDATGISDQFGQTLKFNTEMAVGFVKTGIKGLIDGFVIVVSAGAEVVKVFKLMVVAHATLREGISRVTGQTEWAEYWAGVAEDATTSMISVDATLKKFTDDAADLAANIKGIDYRAIQAGMTATSDATVIAAANAAKLKTELQESEKAAAGTAKAVGDTGAAAAAAAEAATNAAMQAELTQAATTQGITGALLSGDVRGAVNNLGDMLEGVAILGIDIGAILNAITSINKELPKLLFSSIKDLLINLVAELPLLIGNIIPDLIIPILKLFPVIFQRFVENLPIMIDAIILSLPELIQALISMTPNLIKVLPSLLNAILTAWFPNWWTAQKPVLIQTLLEAALAVIEFFRSGIPNMVNDLGTEISLWYKGFFQGLSDDFAALLSALAAQFDEMITLPFVEAIAESRQGFSDGMQSAWEQTFGLLPAMAESVGKTIAGPLGQVAEQLSKIKIGGGGGGGGGAFAPFRFHEGTPFVPRTGMFELQRGERVTSAADNAMAGAGAGGGGDTYNIYASAGMNEDALAMKVAAAVKANRRGLGDQVRRTVERQSN